ncbi:MAG: CatB-related O-acetyltransferase [Hyphomicrobiales bacterium]
MNNLLTNLRYILARALKKAQISAIKSSNIDPTSKIEAGSQVSNLKMGRHSYCGYNCTLINVDIGSFCSIADQVYIGGAGHPSHFVSTSPAFLKHKGNPKKTYSLHSYSHQPQTYIGHDVWIGHGAKIKAGIKIGDGAIVGMGSIVTSDVQPYSIVAGNPARLIRARFDTAIVNALLESQWWNYDDVTLTEAASLFTDPTDFLKSKGLI